MKQKRERERILEPWVFDELTDEEIVEFLCERILAHIALVSSDMFKRDMTPDKEDRDMMMAVLRKSWFRGADKTVLPEDRKEFARKLLTEKQPMPDPEEQRKVLMDLLTGKLNSANYRLS